MPNMQERLESAISQAETDSSTLHAIVHSGNTAEIQTEGGNVPSVAKVLKDVRDSITGGVLDVVTSAESARDNAILAKNAILQDAGFIAISADLTGSNIIGSLHANLSVLNSIANDLANINLCAGNMPNISTALTTANLAKDWANKLDGEVVAGEGYSAKYWALQATNCQMQTDWLESNRSSKAFILNKPTFATVAMTGSYSDLTGIPVLATVASTGSFNDLTDKPIVSDTPTSNGIDCFSTGGAYTELAKKIEATITSPEIGQVIKYDGEKWVNGVIDGTKGLFTPLKSDTLDFMGVSLNFAHSGGDSWSGEFVIPYDCWGSFYFELNNPTNAYGWWTGIYIKDPDDADYVELIANRKTGKANSITKTMNIFLKGGTKFKLRTCADHNASVSITATVSYVNLS